MDDNSSDEYDALGLNIFDASLLEAVQETEQIHSSLQRQISPSRKRRRSEGPSLQPVSSVLVKDGVYPIPQGKVDILQRQIEELRASNDDLSQSNRKLSAEVNAKAGEITIVRKHLAKQAEDYGKAVASLRDNKLSADVQADEISRAMQREIDRLQTELLFKRQETGSSRKGKEDIDMMEVSKAQTPAMTDNNHLISPASTQLVGRLLRCLNARLDGESDEALQKFLMNHAGAKEDHAVKLRIAVKAIHNQIVNIASATDVTAYHQASSRLCSLLIENLRIDDGLIEFRVCILDLLSTLVESDDIRRQEVNSTDSDLGPNGLIHLLDEIKLLEEDLLSCAVLQLVQKLAAGDSVRQQHSDVTAKQQQSQLLHSVLHFMDSTPQVALRAMAALKSLVRQILLRNWIDGEYGESLKAELLNSVTRCLVTTQDHHHKVLLNALITESLGMVEDLLTAQNSRNVSLTSSCIANIAPRVTECLTDALDDAIHGYCFAKGNEDIVSDGWPHSVEMEILDPGLENVRKILSLLRVITLLADCCIDDQRNMDATAPNISLIAILQAAPRPHICTKQVLVDALGKLAYFDQDLYLMIMPFIASAANEEKDSYMQMWKEVQAEARNLIEILFSPDEEDELFEFYASSNVKAAYQERDGNVDADEVEMEQSMHDWHASRVNPVR